LPPEGTTTSSLFGMRLGQAEEVGAPADPVESAITTITLRQVSSLPLPTPTLSLYGSSTSFKLLSRRSHGALIRPAYWLVVAEPRTRQSERGTSPMELESTGWILDLRFAILRGRKLQTKSYRLMAIHLRRRSTRCASGDFPQWTPPQPWQDTLHVSCIWPCHPTVRRSSRALVMKPCAFGTRFRKRRWGDAGTK